LTFCHPPFISFLASPFPWHYPSFCLFASSSPLPSIHSFLYPTAATKGAVPLPIDWVGQSGEDEDEGINEEGMKIEEGDQ